MTKFTTLSPHIGDANHLYEVGEPREIDEPGNAQHLFADKVLGPYDEAAEQVWRDSAAARALAEPATKVDADNAIAALAETTSTFSAETDMLTKERDDARAQIDSLTGERDKLRADLNVAGHSIDTLTKARDDLRAQSEGLVGERDAARNELTAAQGKIATLTQERDDVRNHVNAAIGDRDALRSDLQAAQQVVADLTAERDALKAAAKPHAAKPK